jgi:hypothetical protein
VQLYCKYVNEYYIKENDTVHIIASIESLFLMRKLEAQRWLVTNRKNVVAINKWLDGYCLQVN